jgi:hypothetical protein
MIAGQQMQEGGPNLKYILMQSSLLTRPKMGQIAELLQMLLTEAPRHSHRYILMTHK